MNWELTAAALSLVAIVVIVYFVVIPDVAASIPPGTTIWDIAVFVAIMTVGLSAIMWIREIGHDMMCLDLCDGDKERAKKLHDGCHEDGFI